MEARLGCHSGVEYLPVESITVDSSPNIGSADALDKALGRRFSDYN